MTRKQAVLRAIELLSKNQENQEICKVLENLANELPLAHWTENSILDAVEQFFAENNKLPSSLDYLKVDYLPNRITIKNKLGLTMDEFYDKYYGNIYYNNNSIYNHKDKSYWINIFKEQYEKHNCPGLNDFNKVRDEGTPSVVTYCKIAGVDTWNELLTYCGYPIIGQNQYSKVKPKREKKSYNVVCNFNENVDVEKIKEVTQLIKKIVSNY